VRLHRDWDRLVTAPSVAERGDHGNSPGRKGFIQRVPRTQRYELTSEGYRLAVFFTETYTRIVNPTLADLDPTLADLDPTLADLDPTLADLDPTLADLDLTLPTAIANHSTSPEHGAPTNTNSTPASQTPPSHPEKMTRP
jgi:hypothetical protein